jgi:hypothetical protein
LREFRDGHQFAFVGIGLHRSTPFSAKASAAAVGTIHGLSDSSRGRGLCMTSRMSSRSVRELPRAQDSSSATTTTKSSRRSSSLSVGNSASDTKPAKDQRPASSAGRRQTSGSASSTRNASASVEHAGPSRGTSTSDPGPFSSVSTSSIPVTIEWDNLSERDQAILRLIARPLSIGFTPQEIAKGLGTSKLPVLDLVDELRTELERFASN